MRWIDQMHTESKSTLWFIATLMQFSPCKTHGAIKMVMDDNTHFVMRSIKVWYHDTVFSSLFNSCAKLNSGLKLLRWRRKRTMATRTHCFLDGSSVFRTPARRQTKVFLQYQWIHGKGMWKGHSCGSMAKISLAQSTNEPIFTWNKCKRIHIHNLKYRQLSSGKPLNIHGDSNC